MNTLHAGERARLQFKEVPHGKTINKVPPREYSAFATSKFNPLAHEAVQKGWNPTVRQWTGRAGPSAEVENTSFWCSGWGAVANPIGLDTNFLHVTGRIGHDKALHTRGWR